MFTQSWLPGAQQAPQQHQQRPQPPDRNPGEWLKETSDPSPAQAQQPYNLHGAQSQQHVPRPSHRTQQHHATQGPTQPVAPGFLASLGHGAQGSFGGEDASHFMLQGHPVQQTYPTGMHRPPGQLIHNQPRDPTEHPPGGYHLLSQSPAQHQQQQHHGHPQQYAQHASAHGMMQFADSNNAISPQTQSTHWMPSLAHTSQQASPIVDDLSQWSGPSHSSSRDEAWQAPTSRHSTKQSASFPYRPDLVSDAVSLSGPQAFMQGTGEAPYSSSPHSTLTDAQHTARTATEHSPADPAQGSLPWLQASTAAHAPAAPGSAFAAAYQSSNPKFLNHQDQRSNQADNPAHLTGLPAQRSNTQPIGSFHETNFSRQGRGDSRVASGSLDTSLDFQALGTSAQSTSHSEPQLMFSEFGSFPSGNSAGVAASDRPESSHSSSTASHPSSVIANLSGSERFPNGGLATSRPANELSHSSLSKAFGPTQTLHGNTSYHQQGEESSFKAEGDISFASAPDAISSGSRQQNTTFDSPSTSGGNFSMHTHGDFNNSLSASSSFTPSQNSEEKMLAPHSGSVQARGPDLQPVFATPTDMHGAQGEQFHLLHHNADRSDYTYSLNDPSHAFMTSFESGGGPRPPSGMQGFSNGANLFGANGHATESGVPRFSVIEKTQLPSGGQHIHSTTPTIVEEQEESGQHPGRPGAAANIHAPQAARHQVTGMPGLEKATGMSLKEKREDELARQEYQQKLSQMEQVEPQDAEAASYMQRAPGANSQIQMQTHDLHRSSSTPSVLRRRYKPTVRPTTYQQLAMMNLSDTEAPQAEPGLPDVGFNSDKFIDDVIRHYITCPSRLGLGERTVLIMTSKVAQKSYGAEKRFLCPPPMVLLIGSSWWNSCNSGPTGMTNHYGNSYGADPPTILTPPRVNIGMSGETNNQDGVLEWATSSGRLIDVGNPSAEMAVSGRCIGKQLYISDIDEKRRTCEMLVSLSVPGLSATDARLLGTFASKPIKIISKPSKKRQSNRNTELGILHGSIVSLFHRLRSQTVSTRYLCVSGAPTWFKGSDGQPFLTVDQTNSKPKPTDLPTCFVAKMTSWDPFVVYLVDPNKDPNDPNAPPMKPPLPCYPPPPPSAMAVPAAGQPQMTVHYNQRIVLQCLNTAVVSPIMVIRKVEKASTVVGGAAAPGSSSSSGPSTEALGDPVSQLHKIALEVVEDTSAPAPCPTSSEDGDPSSPGMGGPFLACLNEAVGMRRPPEGRKWVWGQGPASSTPATPMTPSGTSQDTFASFKQQGNAPGVSPVPQSPTSFAAAYAAAQTRTSLSQSRMSLSSSNRPLSSGSAGSSSATAPYPSVSQSQHLVPSSEGGKVRRPRRVSSSIVPQRERVNTAGSSAGGSSFGGSNGLAGGTVSAPTSASKNRRRGQSLSVVEWQREQARQQGLGAGGDGEGLGAFGAQAGGGSSDGTFNGVPLATSWTVDILDSDIWTIVGTDIARHTFYIPPRLVGGVSPPTNVPDSGIAHLITTPAPATPITPIPSLHSFIPPNPQDAQPCVTLFGSNLTPDLLVYFGDWRSTHVEAQSPDTLLCTPPPPASEAFEVPNVRLPIILVRKDGAIFPTDCIYSS